ncbi:MAG: hypothetical protein SVX43_02900 [Cyanobacteriota bacterium]|nr:hypothetical protein [Cyanobacteriota bacterium]
MGEPNNQSNSDGVYIEAKSGYLYGKEVDKIIQKENVVAVVTSSRISRPGKRKLDAADIAYAENIPESEFMESENWEENE